MKQCLSSARRPQTDGQTERTNRTLEDMLTHFVSPSHDDWNIRLPCCEFAINNAWNQSTGSTTFFLNTGSNPRSPVNVDVVCKLPAAESFVGRVSNSIARAKDSLKYAQARMKESYDAKHRAESFETYLTGLQSQARPAPRLGRPSEENPDYVDTLGRNGKTASETPSEKKKKPGRPVEKSSETSSSLKKKLGSVPLEQQSQSLSAKSEIRRRSA